MVTTFIHGGNTNKFRIRQQRYYDKVHVGPNDVAFMHITCIAHITPSLVMQHQFSSVFISLFSQYDKFINKYHKAEISVVTLSKRIGKWL